VGWWGAAAARRLYENILPEVTMQHNSLRRLKAMATVLFKPL